MSAGVLPQIPGPPGSPGALSEAVASLPDRWTAYDDVRWPDRPQVVCDALVIGGAGVFVIVAVDEREPSPRALGRAREDARAAARALSRNVPFVLAGDVHPVVCLNCDLPLSARVDEVAVCSAASLRELLEAMPTLLTEPRVTAVRRHLEACLSTAHLLD